MREHRRVGYRAHTTNVSTNHARSTRAGMPTLQIKFINRVDNRINTLELLFKGASSAAVFHDQGEVK